MNITLVNRIEDYEVVQREDGMVNATEFLNRYNETARVRKRMDVFFRASDTKAFIEELNTDPNIEKTAELEKEKQDGYKPMSRTWWFSPSLFVYFAMWLDVKVRHTFSNELVKVIGERSVWDMYARIVDKLGISGDEGKRENLIKAVDFVVFGKHEPKIWLKAPYDKRCELRRLLCEYEDKCVDGLSYEEFINELRNIYLNKRKSDI